jgi:DNA polymerase-1
VARSHNTDPYFRYEPSNMNLCSLYRDVELPLVEVLAHMELNGVGLNVPYLLEELAPQMEQAAAVDYEALAGLIGHDINTRSYPQKIKLFYEELGERVQRRTPKGNPAVNKYAMALFDDQETVRAVRAVTETLDALSDFVYKLPKLVLDDGRLHGSFNQAGTWEEHGGEPKNSPATGRLSSSGPNLQNISARGRWGPRIRRAFIPRRGCAFVGGDVGQEELRVAALFAGARGLLDVFERGESPHVATARRLGLDPGVASQYTMAKNCNYGLLYAIGADKFHAMSALAFNEAELPFDLTVADARQMMAAWYDLYPEIREWWACTVALCRRQGYSETWFGRRRYLPDIIRGIDLSTMEPKPGYLGRSPKRQAAEREAINMPVQGTGGDVIKIALRRVYDTLPASCRLVLSSHDDVIVEAEESLAPLVQDILEHMTKDVLPVELPVEVKVGRTWEELK